jgi:tRNA pseudouridine13 synthase
MFVSAFQSYIFNCALSQRLDDGHTLNEPLAGDRLIFANGRTDTVTGTNRSAVSLHIGRGRCSIALFMPGKGPVEPRGEGEQATLSLLAEYGITGKDFERASAFVRTKFDGAWRAVALRTDTRYSVAEQNVRLKFSLPPGHYATTVCREFMKGDPVHMV